ncbi:MAG: hypothetical protein A2Y10_19330 [Planctomycetes bacterium GWF2_41_51]|nr:MAG: hypothetical protein A2Y10_19330 [Planctomycetes bacterium GWF2_41_51]HBG25944.1 hypothetical protein [Phycisphaerales bacterium]
MNILSKAKLYLESKLSILPANVQLKFASLSGWKQYQQRLPNETELQTWFNNGQTGLCIVSGKVSGNLEMIDFDIAAEMFEPWRTTVKKESPDLLPKLVIEKSQSGGRHVIYRCEQEICKSLKLAKRKITLDAGDEVVLCGKTFKPIQDKDGSWYILPTYIETRGEGGLFLCAPTPGYELIQNDFTNIPVISVEQRDILLYAALSLNEYVPEPLGLIETQSSSPSGSLRPGDDYNTNGDLRAVLLDHGWRCYQAGENEHWCRPGKTTGTSATLKNRVFYVFSTNAHPFESEKAYSPFSVYTLLEHNGDYSRAAQALSTKGYGDKNIESTVTDVDISALVKSFEKQDDKIQRFADPGPTPVELLRVPGFISRVMDFSMEVSAYPNQAMSFCGGLGIQSYLCGRKVREKGDLRPNIYLLALAGASTGKDYPRKVNAHILTEIGETNCLGDKFASGEGLQDAMFQTPCMLFQNDEVDTMLQSFNKSRDGHLESIMSTLLTMYTSSNSVYPMRRKAGKLPAGFINQPHLTLFGTATPKYYYAALSERMLTNGFIARMITIDVGKRSAGKDAGLIDSMPSKIIETAKWWKDFNPGKPNNLIDVNPVPAIVDYTDKAKNVLDEFRLFADCEYTKAEDSNDEVSKTVWGRANENARKLALLYACSENHLTPVISVDAAKWSVALMTHQLRRMLYFVQCYVADNDFHALCLKLKLKLREAKDRTLPHSVLLKRMKIDKSNFLNIVDTLQEQGDIEIIAAENITKKAKFYRLLEE